MRGLREVLRTVRPSAAPDPADPSVRITRAVAAHLLTYPDAEMLERLPLLRSACEHLEEPHAMPLRGLLDELTRATSDPVLLESLQQEFVETFDTRRRGSLYLTYFTHGDTRRRGMALLRLKQEMREAGVEIGDEELPDHLAVVLEFAGTVDPTGGETMLRAYRPGLELLRIHLRDRESRWAEVLAAVSATLPPLEGEEREAIARLIADGPAEEEVGLAGYGSQEIPPFSSPMAWTPGGDGDGSASGPVPLPTPRIRPITAEGADHG